VEIFLNLAWVILAIALVVLWLRIGCRIDQSLRSQVIAIAVLVAILFPVISVSDDLMAGQNPAETDNCQRRHHQVLESLHLLQATAIMPSPAFTKDIFGFVQYISPANDVIRVVARPALTSIANRPPPVA
jgi:hypothetical protein